MAQIRWTETASDWLERIFEYIGQDSPQAASDVVSGIYQKVQRLAEFPAIGHLYRRQANGDVRVLLYGPYRIAYLFSSREDTVIILGVFHGAMDIRRHL